MFWAETGRGEIHRSVVDTLGKVVRVFVSDGTDMPMEGVAVAAYRTSSSKPIEARNLNTVSILFIYFKNQCTNMQYDLYSIHVDIKYIA